MVANGAAICNNVTIISRRLVFSRRINITNLRFTRYILAALKSDMYIAGVSHLVLQPRVEETANLSGAW